MLGAHSCVHHVPSSGPWGAEHGVGVGQVGWICEAAGRIAVEIVAERQDLVGPRGAILTVEGNDGAEQVQRPRFRRRRTYDPATAAWHEWPEGW